MKVKALHELKKEENKLNDLKKFFILFKTLSLQTKIPARFILSVHDFNIMHFIS